MRSRVRSVAVGAVVVGLLAVAGCADGPPPLDEMSLRDALRADPEVVAALPASARATLARRLEHARVTDAASDAIGDLTGPGAMVGAIDDAREHRHGDPLVVGAVAGGVARPVGDAEPPAEPATVPPVEGGAAVTGSASAALEARALAGEAAATLRALLAASGAHRLVRVSGWPIGAVAIGDVVYVDAAWLVALAHADGEPDAGVDAGADAASPRAPAPDVSPRATSPALGAPTRPAGPPFGNSAPAASAGAAEAAVRALIAAARSNPVIAAEEARVTAAITYSDGGVSEPPPPPPEPATSASCGDTCVAAADACGSGDSSCDSGGDSCDDGSDDSSSCDSTSSDGSDSCNGGTDDGSASCSGGTDDGSASCNGGSDDGTGCQVAGGRRPRGKRHGRLALLCAPLAFLWPRRGR